MSPLVLYSQRPRGESPSCLSPPELSLSSEDPPKAPSPNIVLGFKLKHGALRGTGCRGDSNLGMPQVLPCSSVFSSPKGDNLMPLCAVCSSLQKVFYS